MISFLLNQELRVEQHLDPNMTVLEYLRTQTRKTGTKEGCASGDCGACTVVIAELQGDALHYKSINACLTFIASLDGKQLISVEDLQQGKQLHPVQQAMVDCHASQCGYCTPGFVMSLFALGKNNVQPDNAQIHAALTGNLCRCTGYRPIVAAARCVAPATPDQFEQARAQTIDKLRQFQAAPRDTHYPQLSCDHHQTFSPRSVDELARLCLRYPEARLLAGGTDLALEVTQQHRALQTQISIGAIDSLQQITVSAQQIELGAAATLSACAQPLADEYPDFGALLQRFASLQIRNQATLGGNLGNASPIGDTAPALIALGATIQLRRGKQCRRLPLEAFFIEYKVTALQPGEFIEKIILPRASADDVLRCYKVSKRMDDDTSALLGCFNLRINNGRVQHARIAFGGMAAIPQRARHCEAALCGALWNQHTLHQAQAALQNDFTPLSDFRASAAYRLRVAGNLLSRYFVERETPAVPTRVSDYA